MPSPENLSTSVKIVSALDYADGSADRTGAIIDMLGYESVLMIVKTAAIAAGGTNSIKAQQGALPAMGDAADLAGTKVDIAADDDNQIFYLDIVRPQERYVRLYVDKDGANNMAESAIYIQYDARFRPVVNNVADLVTGELHVSPAEGVA